MPESKCLLVCIACFSMPFLLCRSYAVVFSTHRAPLHWKLVRRPCFARERGMDSRRCLLRRSEGPRSDLKWPKRQKMEAHKYHVLVEMSVFWLCRFRQGPNNHGAQVYPMFMCTRGPRLTQRCRPYYGLGFVICSVISETKKVLVSDEQHELVSPN